MGIGETGRYERRVRRLVRPGGVVLYGGNRYQSDRLLPHVNTEVLIHEYGYCEGIDICECLYPYGTARRRWMPKNKPVWVEGGIIAKDVCPAKTSEGNLTGDA